MKIVRFRNGQYGVRRWSWIRAMYEFLDLELGDTLHWWCVNAGYMGTRGTEAEARTAFHLYRVRRVMGAALRDVRYSRFRGGPPR